MYRDAAVVVRDGVTARQSVDVSCGIEVADGIPAVSDPSQPHDALFKRTFSDPVLASGEFRAMLPAALLEATDFGTLKLCAGSYVDEALVKSESDLLFEAKVAGRDTFFYVLFEHQSQPDPLMPLRMLRYVVRILERYAAEGGGALSLCRFLWSSRWFSTTASADAPLPDALKTSLTPTSSPELASPT